MKWNAVVSYLGDHAHYTITPETGGIYHAHLIQYEGPDVVSPPQTITLIRGVRHWVGSSAEQHFVDELGKVIEHRVREGDSHSL